MATETVANIITAARYELRDPNATQFDSDNVELTGYLNRALVQLDNALSAMNSDWVLTEDATTTLSAAANSVTTPARCVRVRKVWISSDKLIKKLPDYIYYKRKFITATGQPVYFAHKAATIIFEQTADANYDLTIYYDQKTSALTPGGNMPHDDEFNEALKQAMILLAKNRQEGGVVTDAALFDFFTQAAIGKVIGRKTTPKRYKLGF